jgi:hypothetical protein
MPTTGLRNEWFEPHTVLALVGTIFGVLGTIFGIVSHRWAKRESRLDTLGKILHPYVRCAQSLMMANNNRRTCERLKHSFPDPSKVPDVVEKVNELVGKYGELAKAAEQDFRTAEAEFAARHFRFPDNISKVLGAVQKTLSELGRLVNEGFCDKADLQLAKFRDEYKQITEIARGWRLADPVEGLRRHFFKKKPVEEMQNDSDLTQKEMDAVLELLHKRVTTEANNSFAIHPPKKVIANPEILKADDVIVQLKNSIFEIVFQDGIARILSLPELMAFILNLIVFVQQTAELDTMVRAAKPEGAREFRIHFQFSMQQIMQPEMVKALLSKSNLRIHLVMIERLLDVATTD